MKYLSRKIMLALIACSLMIMPIQAFADAQAGDVIVTLGENLSPQQKQQLLNEMGVSPDVDTVTVSNAEEHEYLGNYIAKRLIGTRAISSSKITLGKKNSGLIVKTNHIDWVTDEMYINALATAGVKDAEIYVTAPFDVSGTAALTGIMKAYEIKSDKKIPEEVKQAANQEMVTTAKLGDQIGTDEASALITKIKENISKNPPQTEEETKDVIEQSAKDVGVELTENQKQSLVDLFNKLKDLNINWDKVGDQLNNAKEKLKNYLSSEEGQSFLDKLKSFFSSLIDAIKSFFS
ncbi:DUF1002 domain-containing protein [Bacillus testis]|uniref:DUF1002 domain-containing protein n=1 Tax=Bacillus testis TaxID=1622072 RepID=UPI00067E778A|nr:DUF1002 domain-containing protein [Bacillus testis]